MITLHNNYIFLPKLKKESKTVPSQSNDGNVIHIDSLKSVNGYVKKVFGEPNDKDYKRRPFKMSYTYNIECSGISYNVIFTILTVNRYTYLDICLDAKTHKQAALVMEYIQDKLSDAGIEDNYIEIISYDSISEYYCNKAYPKLNRVERNLRKLLLNTYTVNFGTEYYETTIDLGLQKKIKSVIQASGNENKKRNERLKKFFYSMEFSDIQALLFSKNWTKIEEDSRNEFLLKNEKLTELSEENLRAAFEKFSPKNDWERLFANKANSVDIQKLIEIVRENRNDIAHCKFFYKEQYQSFNQAANELNRTIEEAIRITEEEDFMEKNAENLRIALASVADKFTQFQKQIRESMGTVFESLSKLKFSIPSIDKTFLDSLKMNLNKHYINELIDMKEDETKDESDKENEKDVEGEESL